MWDPFNHDDEEPTDSTVVVSTRLTSPTAMPKILNYTGTSTIPSTSSLSTPSTNLIHKETVVLETIFEESDVGSTVSSVDSTVAQSTNMMSTFTSSVTKPLSMSTMTSSLTSGEVPLDKSTPVSMTGSTSVTTFYTTTVVSSEQSTLLSTTNAMSSSYVSFSDLDDIPPAIRQTNQLDVLSTTSTESEFSVTTQLEATLSTLYESIGTTYPYQSTNTMAPSASEVATGVTELHSEPYSAPMPSPAQEIGGNSNDEAGTLFPAPGPANNSSARTNVAIMSVAGIVGILLVVLVVLFIMRAMWSRHQQMTPATSGGYHTVSVTESVNRVR